MSLEAPAQVRAVLIVDDNPTNLKLARFLLDREGYKVLTAADGEEAIELLRTVRPDLVLMDIQMPGIDGLETTRRLKDDPATSGLTIVALSAYPLESDQAKAAQAGCDGYIPKPIDTQTFPELVRKYLNAGAAAPPQSDWPISTILLAEDDAERRERLAARLAGAGYAVTAVPDGASALETAERDRPDLVLSGILMPRLDGFRLSAAIRSRRDLSRTHVILTTSGSVRPTDEAWARANGATALVPDTEDPRGILEAIRSATTRAPGIVEETDTDSLETIRQAFLLEGREQLNPLLRTDPEDWDLSAVTRTAHRMAGTGGTLGFPQISQTAFQLESLLRHGSKDSPALNQAVADLDRLFEQFEQAGERAGIPDRVRAAISARKFVLAGFSRAEDRRLSSGLEQAGGFVRVQERIPEPDQPCDVLVVSVRALNPEGPPGPWPTIVVGPAAQLSSIQRTSRIELLISPADPAEVLLRSFHLLTQQHDGEEARIAAGPVRVLVADDDPTITALLKSTLDHAGMECHTAGTGREALERVPRLGPDAIVLDVNLPGMDGFEVLSVLKNDARTKSIPVLMLTARQQESDILRGFALGAADYVVKPFSPMEVRARLRRLLKR